MFFVGATGQILTLILTVCLPFVFLISGQQKIEVQSPANYLVVNQNQLEISSIQIITFNYTTDFVTEEKCKLFEIDDFPIIQEFPDDNFHVRWKSVYSKSSGNKAPPVFPCFSC
jgi:hypothetical protein